MAPNIQCVEEMIKFSWKDDKVNQEIIELLEMSSVYMGIHYHGITLIIFTFYTICQDGFQHIACVNTDNNDVDSYTKVKLFLIQYYFRRAKHISESREWHQI